MWNPKGLFFAEMGQYEEALKFYDKALDLNPENVNSMCLKSETL
jgi:tetratricopeptide (TPR) repeat protein